MHKNRSLEYQLLCLGQLIEAPPAMVVDISNFCVGSYALEVLKRVEDFVTEYAAKEPEKSIGYKDYFDNVKGFLKKYASRIAGKDVTRIEDREAHYISRFNFAGWKSFLGDVDDLKDMLHTHGVRGVDVWLHFEEDPHATARWDFSEWRMIVMAGLPEIRSVADVGLAGNRMLHYDQKLHKAVEHELIHMVQGIGRWAIIMKDWGTKQKGLVGLPPRKLRHKGYDPEMKHELRDLEFYTNLGDAMNEFSNIVKHVPIHRKREFLRSFIGLREADKEKYPRMVRDFVGTNWTFQGLQEHDPKKWQLAVKRFLSYLEKNPQVMS